MGDEKERRPDTNAVPFASPATVVKVLDDDRLVVNVGSAQGVKIGQRFLVYGVEREPLTDPASGAELGHLEIVRGTGRVVHVQEKIATVESDRVVKSEKRVITRRTSQFLGGWPGTEEEVITPANETASFRDPEVGDKAKPI